jgi:hypothetical protein
MLLECFVTILIITRNIFLIRLLIKRLNPIVLIDYPDQYFRWHLKKQAHHVVIIYKDMNLCIRRSG